MDEFILTPTSFTELPGWEQDQHLAALRAYDPHTSINTDAAARTYFEQNFIPHKVNDNATGLFTGYFEPVLNGSRTRSEQFPVPIYRRPPELTVIDNETRTAGVMQDGELRPYYTRGEIMAGALAERDLEILWVDSQVDAFFMAIQRSGRVDLPDGSSVELAYDGTNGHPYTAIGALLKDQLPEITMQSIKDWLNTTQDWSLLAANKSYIFFKEVPTALGSCGIPLTPERSLAVDQHYITLGTPVWLDIDHPESGKIQRLTIAQDAGSAIKGPVRGDYFWGVGEAAGRLAGKMKSRGIYYVLVHASSEA